ncbi:MAG: hypothetical protein R3B93_23595 [Bacteroidia bacterium]
MTIEQQEQHILKLVYRLPILRRVRLALTILKGVEPSQIPVDETSFAELIPPSYKGEEELAQRILERKKSYLAGKGKNISRQELMAKIYDELEKEP